MFKKFVKTNMILYKFSCEYSIRKNNKTIKI